MLGVTGVFGGPYSPPCTLSLVTPSSLVRESTSETESLNHGYKFGQGRRDVTTSWPAHGYFWASDLPVASFNNSRSLQLSCCPAPGRLVGIWFRALAVATYSFKPANGLNFNSTTSVLITKAG